MSEYQTTPKQEQAIRDWLQEAIVPLIEQVLVKKLGQAMSFAAEQGIQTRRAPLTDKQLEDLAEQHVTNCYFDTLKYARAIEAAHGIKEKL